MPIGIFGSTGHSFLHTLITTRPLKIIYFDGQSATLTETGTLDSQIALLHGEIPDNPHYKLIYDEDQRALDLCDLVKELGIDGVVRMNAGFEILLCNWRQSGVQELFSNDLAIPGDHDREKNETLPRDPNRQPPFGFGNVFGEKNSFEWLRSATWNYGNYGQGGPAFQQVKVDPCRMVSFYDPVFSSLADKHKGRLIGNQRFQNGWGLRRGHRIADINKNDIEKTKALLRDLTATDSPDCSGVSWEAIAENIIAQHKTRCLEIALVLSNEVDTRASALSIVTKIHELAHAIIYAYLEYSSILTSKPKEIKEQTISRCSSVYTSMINRSNLSTSELLLYHSINAVLDRLCHTEWELFEWSEKYTTQLLGEEEEIYLPKMRGEIQIKGQLLNSTLKWMGWDNWAQCERQCLANVSQYLLCCAKLPAIAQTLHEQELCAIPTWPVIYAPNFPQGGIYAYNNNRTSEEDLAEFWRPKCINKTDFDRGGGRGREPAYQFPDVPQYPSE